MSAEIILDDQHFRPYVEALPKLDPRIKSIENMSTENFRSPNDVGYTINYESEGHKGMIAIIFVHDQEPKPKVERDWGEHNIFIGEVFVEMTEGYSESKVQQFIDWWDDKNSDVTSVYIGRAIMEGTKYLALQFDDIATAYKIEAVGDWVKEIMDSMPKIIKKLNEVTFKEE